MKYQLQDGNIIIATPEFVAQNYPDAVLVVEPPAPIHEPEPTPRHISVGAFFDRFEPLKWTILADPSSQVQAVIKDASVRPYIDLDRADLPAGLQVLIDAGHAIDSAAILGAEIQPKELP